MVVLSKLEIYGAVAAVTVLVLLILFKKVIKSAFRLIKLLLSIKVHSLIHKSGCFSFLDIYEAKVDSLGGVKTVQFISAEDGTETLASSVEELANQVAHWGLKMGCKQLDTIALMMLNSPDFVSIWLGFGKIGISSALINTNAIGNALVHSCQVALESSKVKLLIVDEDLREKLTEEIERIQALGIEVVFWSTRPSNERIVTVKNEVMMYSKERLSHKYRDLVREKDTLLYIFTSGTTGLPKACKISQTKYYLSTLPYRIVCGLTRKDRIYTTMPLYHSAAGMLGVGAALTTGACLVIRKKFSASHFTSDCLKYHVTTFQYIGELCRYLLSSAHNPKDATLNIKYAFGNGLKKDYWRKFQKRFGVKHIVEFYAATEGNAGLVNNFDKIGALGFIPRIVDAVYPLKIVKGSKEDPSVPFRDPKTGHCVTCRPNEVGLLLCGIGKSLDQRFDGYTDKKSTEKKILKDVMRKGDTFFNTGDLLSRDWLGFYYWSDRVGDTFRWKGENVATSEVANAIMTTCVGKGVKDCDVYGVEVPGCEGRAGMAVIVPTDKSDVSEVLAEVLKGCNANLAPYARPLFIRVKAAGEELKTTATFKHVKTDLVKEGFDPSLVGEDTLYYFDSNGYKELTPEVFADITSQKMRF